MGVRRIVTLVVIVAAGCTGGTHRSAPTTPPPSVTTPVERAASLCRHAVANPKELVSNDPTTVQQFRTTTIATVGPSQTHRFPTLRASTFGAWCWTRHGDSYSVYEVADGHSMQVVGGMNGVAPADAHGAPMVP
jgi:hypothetical protein